MTEASALTLLLSTELFKAHIISSRKAAQHALLESGLAAVAF
jgi:hypothetical protein